jgi:hypothetical protein
MGQLPLANPGDVVEVFMETAYVVKSVFQCRESVGDRAYEWRWMFLDDGSLLEVSADGHFRYRKHVVLKQGSGPYEELVAQDGALVRFEERVREGSAGRRPVRITIEGKEFRLTSTGTFRAQRFGEEPELIPWRSISPNPQDNVYFGLVETEDEAKVAVGLWTAHVCLSFGQELQPNDLVAVYRK